LHISAPSYFLLKAKAIVSVTSPSLYVHSDQFVSPDFMCSIIAYHHPMFWVIFVVYLESRVLLSKFN